MLTEQLTVREASVVTHVPVSKVNAMIDDGNLPAGVVVRSRRRTTKKLRFLKPEACAMIKYNASTGVFLPKHLNKRVYKFLYSLDYVKLNERNNLLDDFMISLSDELSVDLRNTIRETIERLGKLNKAKDMVVSDPEVRGGVPTLKGTRLGVYEVSSLIKDVSSEEALATYPTLTTELADAAVLYAAAHPQTGRTRKSGDAGPRRKLVSSDLVNIASDNA